MSLDTPDLDQYLETRRHLYGHNILLHLAELLEVLPAHEQETVQDHRSHSLEHEGSDIIASSATLLGGEAAATAAPAPVTPAPVERAAPAPVLRTVPSGARVVIRTTETLKASTNEVGGTEP